MRFLKRSSVVIASALLALSSLSACSSNNAQKEKVLYVLNTSTFTMPGELLSKFEEETGYRVNLQPVGEDSSIVNTLKLAQEYPQFDVVFGLNSVDAYTAINDGSLLPYTSNVYPESGSDYVISDQVTAIDVGDACVNVDDQWFEKNNVTRPQNFADLAKPEYAKLFVTLDPTKSSTGISFFAATMGIDSEENGFDFWKSMLQGGTKVSSEWTDAYYTDYTAGNEKGEGKYPLVASFDTSPAYHQGATSIIEDSCIEYAEYAAVVKGTQSEELAGKFIDLLLSQDMQKTFPTEMYMFPVDSSVELPQEYTNYAKRSETKINFDAGAFESSRQRLLERWRDLYEQYAS
ncbi:MAG: thiamine ABC transporter substrate-binding protein [Actinomycetaceae bacterium]|nr:thiamine ABC transporter substrate-binding protein [Actinomycetaceae bacterium]